MNKLIDLQDVRLRRHQVGDLIISNHIHETFRLYFDLEQSRSSKAIRFQVQRNVFRRFFGLAWIQRKAPTDLRLDRQKMFAAIEWFSIKWARIQRTLASASDDVRVVRVIAQQAFFVDVVVAGALMDCVITFAPKVDDLAQNLFQSEVVIFAEDFVGRFLHSVHVFVLAYEDGGEVRVPVPVRAFDDEADGVVVESVQRSFNEKHRSDPRQNYANRPEDSLVARIFVTVNHILCSVKGALQHVLREYSHSESLSDCGADGETLLIL